MPEFLSHLFDAGEFMAHGQCYLWNAGLVRLHFASDLAIGLAYLAISLTLVYLVRRAKGDIPFSWVFLCFGTFILACGGTHFMEIWTLWTPVYWLSGAVKFVTAAASVMTALVLPPLVPKTLALIRSARQWEDRKLDLESANEALRREVGERKMADEETRLVNTQLEQRVDARTTELAEANQRLAWMAALVEHSNDAIISLDAQGCLLSWNPAAERLYGYQMEEVLGRPPSMLAPVDLANETDELIQRLNRGERVESFETARVRKTGERIQVALTLSAIRNAAGEIVGVSKISRDITDRKRGEEMFRLAVDASPNAMVMVDGKGVIILVNAQTEKMFGYRREELMGREVDILLPEESRGRHPAHRSEFMHEPRVRAMGAGRELHGLRKDGSEFPVEIGLNPIHTDQGIWVLSAIVDISERKRSEEMFRLAVDASPNAMVMVDGKGVIILVNAQTEKMFGYRREELMGREVDILVPEESRGRHPAYRSEFMHEPRARAMGSDRELHGLRKDGTKFPVEIGLNPIHTDQGTWVLSAIVDISERKRGEEMFRLAVDAAPNAMVMVDGKGIIILVNAQTEKMFGYRREELMGREVDILVPEESRGRHPAYRSEFMHEPRVRAMGSDRELHGLRKDGTKFPVEIGLNPIHTDQGTWVLSAIVDISERKRGEEMFRLAVDAAPNAMVMVDGEGVIILVNAQTEKMFGYRRDELMGREVEILVPRKYRSGHPAYRRDFLQDARARSMGAGRDLYGLRKDGSEFPVEIGLNPIHTDQGTWVLSAIVDISERKRADEEIKSLNQDLERRVKERTAELGIAISELESFSYSVSHDLRAPLRQIAGFSKILTEECGPELSADSHKYLTRVHEGAQQMGDLIDDLLNFAKIGRQPLTRRLTALRTVVDQALEVLNPECAGREIEWQIDSLWTVECDPGLLRQVFINLLQNALKFTRGRASAVIQVGQTALEHEQVIFVRDNGAGFDMQYADKLFGVFQRLHKAEEFEGTGVGLAIAQRIIHKHGGRIWAEARPEKGATFFFTIPNGSGSLRTENGDSGTKRGKS